MQGNLACTKIVEQFGRRFFKSFKNLANHIGWEIFISKGTSYSLETKAGGRDSFAWEVSDIKGLDIRLEIVLSLLIPYNQAFDDASKCGNGTTLIFGNAVEIGFDF